MANYEAYAKGYGDLLADFKKNWQGKISLSQYGQMHYQNYGQKEGRNIPGGSSGGSGPKKFEVDGVSYPKGTSSKILGSNPNEGYKAKATLESGSHTAQENVPGGAVGGVQMRMNKRGQRTFLHASGATYVERDPGSGVFTNNTLEGGTMKISEWTHREQPAPKESAPAPTTSSGVRIAAPVNTASKVGGTTSSAPVNTGIGATQTALVAAINAINAMATGYAAQPAATQTQQATQTQMWPGAPSWVKSFDDYTRWKRQQSAATGFLSTVKTSSTGLTPEELIKNVLVTKLTG
ncbi:MAG: hypothetical protein GY889_14680 [Proteobacteria bacterium]|nr:hypothetical protein [Pseudomonadota bacterium]